MVIEGRGACTAVQCGAPGGGGLMVKREAPMLLAAGADERTS